MIIKQRRQPTTTFEIYWGDWQLTSFHSHPVRLLREFMQVMANRLRVGQARYGKPQKEQRYMTRMGVEMRAYRKTGNREHLVNIANYCWLESVAPEHEGSHWDSGVGSVTRARMRGQLEGDERYGKS